MEAAVDDVKPLAQVAFKKRPAPGGPRDAAMTRPGGETGLSIHRRVRHINKTKVCKTAGVHKYV